jgi:hypothetical protein
MSGEKMVKARSWIHHLGCLPLAWAIMGCAGAVQQKTPPPPGPTGTVAAFLTDSPASGVVSLSLLVSGASLTDSTGKNTAILSSTEQPELRHLELAPTLLVQAPSIPTGSFSSAVLTLANPQISVSDSTGNVRQLDGSTTPSVKLTNSSVSLPVSLSVTANSLIGMQLDVDLGKSLSIDSSGNYIINPIINVSIVDGTKPELDVVDTVGTVSALSTNSFTVQLPSNAGNVTVDTDSSTVWSSDIGQFSNLLAGQTIEMNAEMQSSGSYLAKFIGSSTANLPTTYEGILTHVQNNSSASSIIDVTVQ